MVNVKEILSDFEEIKEEFEILEQMMLEMKEDPNRKTVKTAREQAFKLSIFLDSIAADMAD